jgi:hypothetical protein
MVTICGSMRVFTRKPDLILRSEGEEEIRKSRLCQHKGLNAPRVILRRAAPHIRAMVLYNPRSTDTNDGP